MRVLGKRIIAAPLIFVVAIASNKVAQDRIDSMKGGSFDEELLFLPNDRLLTHFTVGLSSVIADILWVRAIDYASREFHNPDRKFTWLADLVNMVVRLDPYFEGAYARGGMLLAGIGADDEALNVLHRGLIANPYSSDISFELIQVFLLNRREREETPRLVGHYLRIAAELAENEEYARYYLQLAHDIGRKYDLLGHAMLMWQDVIANADDDVTRQLAEERLLDLIILENVKMLGQVLTLYAEHMGKQPERLDEVIAAGVLNELPGDKRHGRYFIDAAGEIQNTVLLESRRERVVRALNSEMRRFREAHGRYADSLEEWSRWSGGLIPEHPYDGESWAYDNGTGELR
ncbi:MAG: hypothetical protein QGG73_07820 [Candidatus Hydrogenedentes bacterium]|jgi:hypothetical protein|nr:hypothetical protein [Candidatus Hydrogenedentota bacterium]